MGLAHPGPPRARAHRRRGDHHRPARPGPRQRGRHGHGGPPRARPVRPGRRAAARARSTTTSTCICSDGDIEEGISHEVSVARRPPEAGQPHRHLRRQPDLHRGRHQRSPSPRTSPPATRRTAGTCRPSTGAGRTATYDEDVAGAVRGAARRPRRRPTGPRSSRCARSSAGRRRTSRTPARRTARRWAPTRWRATKQILGFDPDKTLRRRPTEVLAHAREVRRAAGRAAHAEWQTRFDAWAQANPERHALLDRLATRTPAGRLDRRAAEFDRPTPRAWPPARPPARC